MELAGKIVLTIYAVVASSVAISALIDYLINKNKNPKV